MDLNAFDWIIIVGYFAVTLGIGFYFSGRAGANLTEYFLSGRSLPWWIAGTSMVATTFAADTPLAVTGLVAKNGLAGNWVWWAFATGGMFTVFVYAKLWRRAEVMTDVELIELRYGGKPAAVLRCMRALYVALIINPIIIGWVTKAMLTVLKETVLYTPEAGAGGGFSDWLIIAACLAVVAVYATLSGLWGVAIADFIQFITAMVGCILLAYFALDAVGGIEVLQAKVAEKFEDGEQAFRFIPDFTAENPWMPVHVFLIMLTVQWWATWYPGAEPGGGGYIVQRMASCKDERHTVLATLWYQVAHYCVRPWPWLIVAFVALVQFPEVRDLATGVIVDENRSADAGFAMVMREMSPNGLKGLMLVTFFAAFMSTISTQMNWGASYLVRDVYQRFIAPEASDKQLTQVSRMVSVLVLVLGGVAAWIVRSMDVDEIWKALLALGAGTGLVFMLRWFWWRINAWSEIVAMLGSLFFYFVFKDFEYRGEPLSDEVRMLAIAGATIACWLLVTFITPAESRETLLKFFRKVHPSYRGWSPIADEAPEVETDQYLGLSIVAAITASCMVYLILPGIGFVIFQDYTRAILCLVGAAVCASIVYLLMRKIGWENVV